MSARPDISQSFRGANLDSSSASSSIPSSSSFWDRISSWVSENKAIVYTIAGVAVVVTGAGAVYYFADSKREQPSSGPRLSKKERRKAKKEKEKETNGDKDPVLRPATPDKQVTADPITPEEQLPDVDEDSVSSLSDEERKEYANKLKVAGNKAYNNKLYDAAIDLYGKAIICKPDPIYYSNRAACYNALGQWENTIEDTTAALALNSEYVKALNRRAHAYENIKKFSEALVDYTASCIIDQFTNNTSAEHVERLLKLVAESKADAIMVKKEKKLPSAHYITTYFESWRSRPRPEGLEDSTDLDEHTGKGQLQVGLSAMTSKTGEGYEKAAACFEKALELGELGGCEALAYNMRGTFRYLMGENSNALEDLSKSIELQPSFTQSLIKRASMYIELQKTDVAAADLEKAVEQNAEDPDIYYHRGQFQFIGGKYAEAAKDFQKSIDLDKDFFFSHIQLGVTQYRLGSIASSMATFRRCIKNFDKVPDVYNYYGELLLDQQKFKEAIEKFETALEMEKQTKPLSMNVIPLVNKALASFQQNQDFPETEKLLQKALIIDPECDVAIVSMAQLLLQQNRVTDALKYFERAAELSRTRPEVVEALSYAEATRTQLEVQQKYPQLASRVQGLGGGVPGAPR